MTDLELTRTPQDRRLYALEGVGTLRLEGVLRRRAVAEADGRRWTITRRGFGQRSAEAVDAAGAVAGTFAVSGLRRGGAITWAGVPFALRPASRWRERFALSRDDHELAVLDGKGWGKRPVKVTAEDVGAVDPGLLLFAAFVVRALAEDSAAAAAS